MKIKHVLLKCYHGYVYDKCRLRDTGVRKGSRSAQVPCLWHRDPLTDLLASNWCTYLACNRRGRKCDSVLRHVS